MILAYIIIFTLIGSILSLLGGFALVLKNKLTDGLSNKFIAFAAGALLSVAFLDLFPEAVEEAGELNVFIPALIGFISFFFAERYLRLFHHHHKHGKKPTIPLILIGDGIHNFVDGVVIAVAFLASIPLGITTSLAVAAHEVPQEIADMGVLLANGLSRSKAIFYNLLSGLTALVGALGAFFFSDFVEQYLYLFLSVAAGHFIYIAASDLVPELHEKIEGNKLTQTIIFLSGVIVIFIFTRVFEA